MLRLLRIMVSKLALMQDGRFLTDPLHFEHLGQILVKVYKSRLVCKTIVQAVVNAGQLHLMVLI